MKRFFATSASPFMSIPGVESREAFRLQGTFHLVADQLADAELAADLFAQTGAAYHQAKDAMFATFVPGSADNVNYLHRLKRMYAREFVYAVDNFIKMLEVFSQEPHVPAHVADAVAAFKVNVPGVIEVRNSLHHLEDRARGKARKKDIQPKPINKLGLVVEEGATMFVNGATTFNDSIGNTSASGELVTVPIGDATLQYMVDALQAVLDGFQWDSHLAGEQRWPHAAL